ncbi:class I SAM-dependent methyltransferase [Rhodococcus sp. H29-C3]|uniref:class I SAM-dependent methyltransferase n=1 Tax=Rhodococcus sp. H29-C3 TaxID=3046307 RepID=UPI0024BAD68B|nr:class I SAM-dependent methyltransferase [Rhodococcus sp. H29-C3]MDJ0361964.1 class I SAM-dependent methyltransferase [Rhodococcus sp. H29-C3]
MTETTEVVDADRALKAALRTMWGLGNYPAVAAEVVQELGPTLVRACGVEAGQRVLDVAAGSGNAALPAAAAGATVIASDLTPELFARGRELAAAQQVDLEWIQGDAEALPFADNEFDIVMSCVGVMFAPHHQQSADELVRVCRDGGTIGLINWTPDGFIGKMFSAMKPYAAPPPPGAQPPPLWGDEAHVRGLFGDRVREMTAEVRTLTVDMFARPEDFVHYFKKNYGPTIAVYRRIADDHAAVRALDSSLIELAGEFYEGKAMQWQYLIVVAIAR